MTQSPRPGRPARRPWRVAVLALVAGAGALLGLVVLRGDRVEVGTAPSQDGAARGPQDAPAPALAVPSVRGVREGDGPAVDASNGAAPAPDAAPGAPTAASSFPAVAPGRIDDRVARGGGAPVTLLRSDLVGSVGPFGVRRAPAPGLARWAGVAQVRRGDRASSEAADDTQEPASTAVRGVVVTEDDVPVPGAEVILYSSFYLRQAYYDHRVRQIGRTWTDAAGVFDLRPVALDTVHFGADGEVLVTVRHAVLADLVAQPLSGVVPGRESDVGRLVLPARSVTIRGVIRDMEGHPSAGAVVRASGVLDPVRYDKTERMVVLDDCPYAVADDEGRYVLTGFAAGLHQVSIHVRLDCVVRLLDRWEGEREWSPVIRPGNSVRGRVVDPEGEAVAAAVVAGGENWTPTNPDGTFWLDNVVAGPLTLEVAHHAWHTVFVPGVPTNAEEVTIRMERPLARVTLHVADGAGKPIPLVAIDWAWPPGGGPGRFAPESRFWHDPSGVFRLTVPEGAVGATVSDDSGAAISLAASDLADGVDRSLVLVPAAPVR